MDGYLTFATWDAASQHVADKVVRLFGGTITVGEVDPANVGRDGVRQFYDALETSDAIGNYGVDTTIPNYVIHTITFGGCPVLPVNNVFLCYSKFEVDPGTWSADQASELMSEGYWSPIALTGNRDGGTNIGGYHLVCNPPSTALVFASTSDVESYVGADGTVVGSAVAGMAGYYPLLG